MPGVPREMKPMLVDRVVPFLRERFGADATIVTRVIHTIGLGESDLDQRIDDLFREGENPKIAVLGARLSRRRQDHGESGIRKGSRSE